MKITTVYLMNKVDDDHIVFKVYTEMENRTHRTVDTVRTIWVDYGKCVNNHTYVFRSTPKANRAYADDKARGFETVYSSTREVHGVKYSDQFKYYDMVTKVANS